jgi:DNA-binding LacI/PurR family transcriptional regulator
MATIYDIAKAAGVTATTVSYVLSGKGSVSAATRSRVMKFAQELGYQPNLVARSLIKGRTGIIGLALPNIENPFYSEIIAIVERLAYKAGLRVFVTTLTTDDVVGQKLLGDLVLRQVDGLLVLGGCPPPHVLQTIVTPNLPIVWCLWEGPREGTSPSVDFHFYQGGQLAAEHLLGLGHRRFGVVADTASDGSSPSLRVTGFREALAAHDVTIDPELIQSGQYTAEGGKEAGHKLLTHPNPPTAVFATNDFMAIGVMAAAWELGKQIPRDLSIVGLDDISLASYTTPPLTTIVIDKPAVMSLAIETLLRAIDGQATESSSMYPATLAVRGSTALCTEHALNS